MYTAGIDNGTVTTDLDRLKEREHAILDHALDAFVETDPDGLITAWNLRAEILFGWPRPEALGRKFSQAMIAPGAGDAYDKSVAKLLNIDLCINNAID
jgi:PAS domain S-box-containing protein